MKRNYDDELHIATSEEQEGFHKSFHHHRYEPTPYEDLDVLFHEYKLSQSDCIVDFGCGKGRLNFYLYHFYNVDVVGIEMDETFYRNALENKQAYFEEYEGETNRVQFYQCLAQQYVIKPTENLFYFFNPFSEQLFMKVVNNILVSVEEHPRKVEIILYYPSVEYTYYLETSTVFTLELEIRLDAENERECFLVYQFDPTSM